jgi:hypothetical protein
MAKMETVLWRSNHSSDVGAACIHDIASLFAPFM